MNNTVTTPRAAAFVGLANLAVGFLLGFAFVFAWGLLDGVLLLGVILAVEFVFLAGWRVRHAPAVAEDQKWRRTGLVAAAEQAGIGWSGYSLAGYSLVGDEAEAMQAHDWDVLLGHGWTPAFIASLHQSSNRRVPEGFLIEVARGLFGTYDLAVAHTWFAGLASDRVDPALYRDAPIAAALVRHWIATFGTDLAPLAYAAGLSLPDAVAMKVAGTLTPEVLRTLALLRGVETLDADAFLKPWTAGSESSR